MLEEHNSGTSINIQELLELDTTTNPSIFTTQEKEITCKYGALTPTGGRFSNTNLPTL
jgi:transaldolase